MLKYLGKSDFNAIVHFKRQLPLISTNYQRIVTVMINY